MNSRTNAKKKNQGEANQEKNTQIKKKTLPEDSLHKELNKDQGHDQTRTKFTKN